MDGTIDAFIIERVDRGEALCRAAVSNGVETVWGDRAFFDSFCGGSFLPWNLFSSSSVRAHCATDQTSCVAHRHESLHGARHDGADCCLGHICKF